MNATRHPWEGARPRQPPIGLFAGFQFGVCEPTCSPPSTLPAHPEIIYTKNHLVRAALPRGIEHYQPTHARIPCHPHVNLAGERPRVFSRVFFSTPGCRSRAPECASPAVPGHKLLSYLEIRDLRHELRPGLAEEKLACEASAPSASWIHIYVLLGRQQVAEQASWAPVQPRPRITISLTYCVPLIPNHRRRSQDRIGTSTGTVVPQRSSAYPGDDPTARPSQY